MPKKNSNKKNIFKIILQPLRKHSTVAVPNGKTFNLCLICFGVS